MSRVWYTSDPHFGHKRVSEIRGFEATEEHDQHIIDKWNRVVKKNDIVYVLGDIAVGKHKYALDILKNLPGRKHLISGNHDIVHPYHSRGQSKKEQEQWLNTFETIQPFLLRKSGGHKFLMSHFPYPQSGDGSTREGSRYDQFRLPDRGIPLLHGHTHGKETFHDSFYSTDWFRIKNQLHVGWDAWETLVPEDTVLEWLNETYIVLSPENYATITEEPDNE
jgi:calcineurin-like phosphoesterase family protein